MSEMCGGEGVRLFIKSEADFSPCRLYRYTLWRRWGTGKIVNFICLNPSTADETKDDNTIRKCIKFAQTWGYESLCVTNLFAYRSTDPEAMKRYPEPVGPHNDYWLSRIATAADLVICAWSQHGSFLDRAAEVLKWLPNERHVLRMGKGKKPQPWHPLYLPDVTKPVLWNNNQDNDIAAGR